MTNFVFSLLISSFVVVGCFGVWRIISLKGNPIHYTADVMKTVPSGGMIFTIFPASIAGLIDPGAGQALLTAGFMFCFMGDIFLGVAKNMFIYGLASFFVGYGLFMINCFQGFQFNVVWLVLTIIFVVIGAVQYCTLKNLPKALKIPVLLYLLLLTSFLSSGVNACQVALANGNTFGAFASMIGISLIYISDSCIAQHNFRKPMSLALEQIGINVLYFIGIGLFMASYIIR